MTLISGRFGTVALALASILCAAKVYRATAQEAASPSPTGFCPAAAPAFAEPPSAPNWNGWGADPSQHRFQPTDMAKLAAEDVPRLRVKWAFGFPGASRAFAQPTVMGGRIFVGSQNGKVYSLDAKSGCVHWTFDARTPVRSAVTIGQNGADWLAYFGDLSGNVYALDVLTGRALWKVRVDEHPGAVITGSPTLVGTTLLVPVTSYEELTGADPHYPCCNFRGSVVSLEAATGKVVWKSYTIAEKASPRATNSIGTKLMGPSGAGVWSSPTFDAAKRMVYVTTSDNYSDPPTDTSDAILAFDAASGQPSWSRQITSGDAFNVACAAISPGPNCPMAKGPDLDFGSSPILVSLAGGKRALIASQKSGVVTAVDPDHDGEILWQTRVGRGGALGGVEWGSAADDSKVYAAVSDTKINVVTPGTLGAQVSPFDPRVGWLLDSKQGGGLHALRLDTGAEVWQRPHPGCHEVPGCGPAQSAAVTVIPGVVFSGSLDGHIRAYSADDGRIIWDVDTASEYATVNGVPAHGGSIDGPGTVVVDGMVYLGSGSGLWGGKPGNVLLAFSVDGR